jgi:hypothetical protein
MGSRRDKVGKGRVVAINLTGGLLRKLIGVGVAIAIGVGWWGFNLIKEKATAPDVGECVTVSGPSSDVEVEDADCGDDDVLYKVVGKGECDEIEDSVVTEIDGKEAVTLCLWPDVADGSCIRSTISEFSTLIDCAEADSDTFKIVASLDDASEACPKRSEPLTNETRDLVICVGRPS